MKTSFPLVDAHTHQTLPRKGVVEIKSLSSPDEPGHAPQETFFHFGSHPWDALHYQEESFATQLKAYQKHPHFVGLGECGLDRAKMESWQEQLHSLSSQLALGREYKIKTVVIHCVKAYSEILRALDSESYQGQVIFHDFNAGLEVAQELCERGYFLSLGKTLGRDNSKVRQFLEQRWLSHLLLETDAENMDIATRYQELEELLGIEVKEEIYQNSLRAFNRSNWDR